jgi:hypothetical protein
VTAAAREGAAGGGALPPCARRTDYAARAVAAVRGGVSSSCHSTLTTLRLVRRSWVGRLVVPEYSAAPSGVLFGSIGLGSASAVDWNGYLLGSLL